MFPGGSEVPPKKEEESSTRILCLHFECMRSQIYKNSTHLTDILNNYFLVVALLCLVRSIIAALLVGLLSHSSPPFGKVTEELGVLCGLSVT